MKFRNLLFTLVLPALFLQAEEKLTFDDQLTGWKPTNRKNIRLDDGVAPGSRAVRLENGTSLKRMLKLEPDTRYELTYYIKGKDIEPGAKNGARIMINGGKLWARITTLPKNQMETGSFDWKKGSAVIDTARYKTGDIAFFLALTGKGTVWFDGLQLKKLAKENKPAVVKTSYQIKLFPAYLTGDRFAICENLPGTLEIDSSGKPKSKKSASMILDLPEWVDLIGVCENLSIKRGSGFTRIPSEVKSEKITRDGKSYTRNRITFDRNFLQWFGQSWYRLNIFLNPKAGSAGKKGRVFWSFDIGGEKFPEQSFALEILKPVIFPESPCREFTMLFFRSRFYQTPFGRNDRRTLDFWDSLSQKRIRSYSSFLRDKEFVYPGYEPLIAAGGNMVSTLWDILEKEMAEFRNDPKIPKDVTDKGKLSKHSNSPSVWYLVDDPEGRYEKYLRTIFRKLKQVYPKLKYFSWDFEPHPYGYDEGGRARFAKKMNLDHVPSIEEINGKYYAKWFDYMVKLHAQLIEKTVRIFHEEMPGAHFWLCSDNLHAAEPHVARWCGVDVRLSDAVVDGHKHMPYYSGTRYFDDLAYNLANLKKPYLPLIDPAERIPSFFRQYSAPKVLQNTVATAALGAKGIGFYPDDVLPGEYFPAIAEAFRMVAAAEEFYFHGKRCDRDFTVRPRNVVSRKLDGGKEIMFPDFTRSIRYTAHEKDGKYLLTLFNYDSGKALIAEVSGRDFGPVLVKVPPEGCVLTGTGKVQDQSALKREIAAFSGSGEMFRDHTRGNARAVWAASAAGLPVLLISDGKLSAAIDIMNTSHAVSLKTADNTELLANGFAGRLSFADRLQPKLFFRYVSHGITAEGVPFAVSRTEVAPYDGANPIPNPLYQLKIERRFEIRNGKLAVTHTFTNPTDKPMPLKGRLNNYPWPGHRFQANHLTFAGKTFDQESVRIVKPEWKNKPFSVTADNGALREGVRFEPDPKFDGLYSWAARGESHRRTVEFIFDIELPAGQSVKYTYTLGKE